MSVPPAPSSEPKFRVAICGAGIGGLVLAITIGKYNPSIPIDLYEAQDSIGTAGVGITCWKKTHKVLIDLGLFDDFKQIFTHAPDNSKGPKMRRSDIREGGYPWFQRPNNLGPSSMQRQHMIAVLERHLPASCTLHSNKRLVNYMEPEKGDAQPLVRLVFMDGTTATADVLVGADGVRSAVRKTMFELASKDNENEKTDLKQYIDASFTGMSVYRALIPAEMLRKESPENKSLTEITGCVGKGRFFGTYPVAKGSMINVVAYVGDQNLAGTRYEGHWVSDATREELVEYYDHFEPDIRAVVKLCERPSKWALHTVKPLPFCVRNRVALIGDACHAMTPHFGAGSVQAIEDAFMLGRLLAHPLTSLPCIQDAMHIYEQLRFPFACLVANLSISTGWMYMFMEPGYYDGTRKGDDLDDRGIGSYEREGMETIKQEILRRWSVMDESPDALQAWTDAEEKLQALAGPEITN